MFFVEGVPAVLLGVLALVLLPRRPRHGLYMSSPLLVMTCITICGIGVFAAIPVFWQLPNTFLAGVGAAAGIGLINSFGNLSGS